MVEWKKNQIGFLEDREVIWPQTKKLDYGTFFKLSFEREKTHAY